MPASDFGRFPDWKISRRRSLFKCWTKSMCCVCVCNQVELWQEGCHYWAVYNLHLFLRVSCRCQRYQHSRGPGICIFFELCIIYVKELNVGLHSVVYFYTSLLMSREVHAVLCHQCSVPPFWGRPSPVHYHPKPWEQIDTDLQSVSGTDNGFIWLFRMIFS